MMDQSYIVYIYIRYIQNCSMIIYWFSYINLSNLFISIQIESETKRIRWWWKKYKLHGLCICYSIDSFHILSSWCNVVCVVFQGEKFEMTVSICCCSFQQQYLFVYFHCSLLFCWNFNFFSLSLEKQKWFVFILIHGILFIYKYFFVLYWSIIINDTSLEFFIIIIKIGSIYNIW